MAAVKKPNEEKVKALNSKELLFLTNEQHAHFVIGDPVPLTPLFDDRGIFRFKEFLRDRSQFLVNYPVGRFIGLCLYSIIELEGIYDRMNVSSHYGAFGDFEDTFAIGVKDQPSYENMQKIAICWMTLISGIRESFFNGSRWDWNVCNIAMTNIGWLKREVGIDIEGIRGDVKKGLTKNATEKRKETSDLLKEKIESLAKPFIAKYPSKPATEIYGYLKSELSSFAKAREITRGLSQREVISKISKVKNQAK